MVRVKWTDYVLMMLLLSIIVLLVTIYVDYRTAKAEAVLHPYTYSIAMLSEKFGDTSCTCIAGKDILNINKTSVTIQKFTGG